MEELKVAHHLFHVNRLGGHHLATHAPRSLVLRVHAVHFRGMILAPLKCPGGGVVRYILDVLLAE